MREIKFRAWSKAKLVMLNNVGYHPFICEFHIDDYKPEDEGAYTISPAFESYELMQFTGLTDKNGVPIYEGDIVKKVLYSFTSKPKPPVESIGEVKYHQESASFLFYKWCYTNLKADNIELEVIGNIHQHPHLL